MLHAALSHLSKLRCTFSCCCPSLTMLPSIWRDVELKVSRPRRRLLPLTPRPGVDVVPGLPPLGSAVPVIMEAGNVPRGGLPAVGSWVKLKVVGLLVVQVRLLR
jgi:hypothetical protein